MQHTLPIDTGMATGTKLATTGFWTTIPIFAALLFATIDDRCITNALLPITHIAGRAGQDF
jgi:hypothetical protein